MRTVPLALLALAVRGGVALAPERAAPPPPAIRVVHSTAISSDEPEARHVESVVAVNPGDVRNLVAAAIVLADTDRIAVYASRDGGRTWTRSKKSPLSPDAPPSALRGGDDSFDGLDPAVAFDRAGTAWFLSMGAAGEVIVWTSRDGGLTWSRPATVAGLGWDRPWIACMDATGASFPERVFVAGKLPVTVFGEIARDIVGVSGSSGSSAGASFRFPRLFLPRPSADVLNAVSDLVVDTRGRIVVTLQLFPPGVVHDEVLAGNYGTIVSEDGGRTFSAPRKGPDFHVYGHANEGKSLMGLGLARMAVDRTAGPYRGRLHLAWNDADAGFYRIRAAYSSDGGATWSAPLFVASGSESDASTAAVAVDGKGTVGVSWYDRGADFSDGCYQLYFAASTDGGATFSAPKRLDETPTCPLGPRERSPDPLTSEYRFKNGGDTQGIVGLPDGGFQLAWIRAGEREMQLWSTSVEVR